MDAPRHGAYSELLHRFEDRSVRDDRTGGCLRRPLDPPPLVAAHLAGGVEVLARRSVPELSEVDRAWGTRTSPD